jgi:hypothetical protein
MQTTRKGAIRLAGGLLAAALLGFAGPGMANEEIEKRAQNPDTWPAPGRGPATPAAERPGTRPGWRQAAAGSPSPEASAAFRLPSPSHPAHPEEEAAAPPASPAPSPRPAHPEEEAAGAAAPPAPSPRPAPPEEAAAGAAAPPARSSFP